MTLEEIVQELEKHPGITVSISSDGLSIQTESSNTTFEEWAWRWAISYKQGVVKDNTYLTALSAPYACI